MENAPDQFHIRRARIADVRFIHGILMHNADNGLLLPRPLNQLYSHIRDFYVLEKEDGTIGGCCALAITWEDIAEIRSLAVNEALRGQGFGAKLVHICLDEAKELGLKRVFTLTYQVGFFQKLHFAEVSKDVLPQKVWADCIHCPKFPECDEHAMLIELEGYAPCAPRE